MSLVADDEVALRRAALTLHAMAEPDRDWVLSGLDASQRKILQPLLAELRGLGIPEDLGVAHLPDGAEPAVIPAPRSHDHWLRTLDDQGVKALAQVLSSEPPQVARTLLALDDWPWGARLLQALGGDAVCPEQSAPAAKPSVRLGRELAALLQFRWQDTLAALPSPQPPRLTGLRGWWCLLRGRA